MLLLRFSLMTVCRNCEILSKKKKTAQNWWCLATALAHRGSFKKQKAALAAGVFPTVCYYYQHID